MDIFTSFDSRLPSIKPKNHSKKVQQGKNLKKKEKTNKSQKMELSPERIRELVAKNKPKPKILQTTSKESKVPGFLKIENDPENKSIPKGDLGSNKHDSEVTQGKLKDALNNGSFKFSEKERAVLDQILN